MRARTLRKMMRLLSGAALLAMLGPTLLAAAPALADDHDHAHAEDSAHEHCEAVLVNTGAAPLAPGVWTVHHDRDALWGPGLSASAAFEQLVEGANPAMAVAAGMNLIDTLLPGASARFSFDNDAGDGVYLSTASMIFNSNDSFVGVANVRLLTDRGEPVLETFDLLAWDAGTEENEPLGGGFDAGQPDVTRGTANLDNGMPTDGGLITENNPQYGNEPQARLTLRCENVDVSHAEAVAITSEGGDPFTIGDEDADMPSEPDADAAGETPAEPSDAMDGDMPPEPDPDAAGETPAEPSDAMDGEMPPEPQPDAATETPAETPDAMQTEGSAEDDTAAAPPVGTGLAPADNSDSGPTLAILLALAAAVAALGGATLAVRRSRR